MPSKSSPRAWRSRPCAPLIALCLLACGLPAQDGPQSAVWRFLRAEGRKSLAATRKELRAQEGLGLEQVLSILAPWCLCASLSSSPPRPTPDELSAQAGRSARCGQSTPRIAR